MPTPKKRASQPLRIGIKEVTTLPNGVVHLKGTILDGPDRVRGREVVVPVGWRLTGQIEIASRALPRISLPPDR